MAAIKENVNLKPFNTFGIEARCRYFFEVNAIEDFLFLVNEPLYKNNPKLIIGGGSNLLFTKNFNGIVIKNNLKGIEVVAETADHVTVSAAAGEVWHSLVLWSLSQGLGGLENLSLIPGCVGASPMQNIGAYGVEIKEVFQELEAYDLTTGKKRIFSISDCGFGYRESVFKNKYKNQYLIAWVTFRLNKHPSINTQYGAINTELQAMKIDNPGIKDVSEAVIRIRQSKLPDPAVTGNAGSFFKNPEVSAEFHAGVKKRFPDIVAYPLESGKFKLAAGWLIEQCGLKGFEQNGAAVHDKQALVLVNKNNAKGSDVFALSELVIEKVNKKFGVMLEREVNIV